MQISVSGSCREQSQTVGARVAQSLFMHEWNSICIIKAKCMAVAQ